MKVIEERERLYSIRSCTVFAAGAREGREHTQQLQQRNQLQHDQELQRIQKEHTQRLQQESQRRELAERNIKEVGEREFSSRAASIEKDFINNVSPALLNQNDAALGQTQVQVSATASLTISTLQLDQDLGPIFDKRLSMWLQCFSSDIFKSRTETKHKFSENLLLCLYRRFSKSKQTLPTLDDVLVPMQLYDAFMGPANLMEYESRESHTQSFWFSMFSLVRDALISLPTSDSGVMDVVDSSRNYLLGTRKQPDFGFTLQGAPPRFYHCVKGFVEVKKEGGMSKAIPQLVQRRSEIASMAADGIRGVLDAVADDKGIAIVHYCLAEFAEERSHSDLVSAMSTRLVASITRTSNYRKYTPELFLSHVASLFFLLRKYDMKTGKMILEASEPSEADTRRMHSENGLVTAVLVNTLGKSNVHVIADRSGLPLFLGKEYVSTAVGDYEREKSNIRTILAKNCDVAILRGVEFVDSQRTIRFLKVAHRIRLNSCTEVESARNQFEEQLRQLYKADLYHGDVSCGNLVMRCDDDAENVEKASGCWKEIRLAGHTANTDLSKTMPKGIESGVGSNLAAAVSIAYYRIGFGAVGTATSDCLKARDEGVSKDGPAPCKVAAQYWTILISQSPLSPHPHNIHGTF